LEVFFFFKLLLDLLPNSMEFIMASSRMHVEVASLGFLGCLECLGWALSFQYVQSSQTKSAPQFSLAEANPAALGKS
jgi:hypothetical protein